MDQWTIRVTNIDFGIPTTDGLSATDDIRFNNRLNRLQFDEATRDDWIPEG